MAVDWKTVGLPRWYDCKLGRLKDQALARLVGTTKGRIRARRLALGIAACSVNQVIEPFRHLLGVESDRVIAARCGASISSVTTYRESLGIPAKPRPVPLTRQQRIPLDHPVRPYKALLGLVSEQDIRILQACLSPQPRHRGRHSTSSLQHHCQKLLNGPRYRILKARGLGTSRCLAACLRQKSVGQWGCLSQSLNSDRRSWGSRHISAYRA